MNKKFKDTIIFKNLQVYKRMRVNIELLLIFNIIKYFNCKNILEIGFYQGQTFGALLEATDSGILTAVDFHFDMSLYDQFYKNSECTQNKEIKFCNTYSTKFKDDPKKYDFINIDGDHTLPVVYDDFLLAIKLIKESGILMIDDFYHKDIDRSIDKFLTLKHNFVPFLISKQSVYFHHISHDASTFLDTNLKNIFESFCYIDNIEYKNYNITKISALPAVTNNNDIFSLICERYNL